MKEDYINNLSELAKEESNLSEEDMKKMEEYIEENYEELIPEQYVVRGSTLKCTCGSHERKLDMLKDHAVYVEGFPMIHELDKELEENIKYFGVCSSGSPLLNSESVKLVKISYDEEGNEIKQTVKGTKCQPYIIGNWRDTKENVRIVDNGDKDGFDKFRDPEDENKGYRAVTTKSFLICRHGGIIEPLDSGQVMIESEENNQEEPELQDNEDNGIFEYAIPFVAGMGIGLLNNNNEKSKVKRVGAFNSNINNKRKGLGKLENIEIKVSKKGLDIVKGHLGLFPKFKPNTDMIERLEKALDENKMISGADAIFYTHELKENFLMKKILKVDKLVNNDNKKFIDTYDYAHNEALEFYNVSPFSVYHKDVILQNEDDFNFNWLKFWNNLDK